MSMFVDEVFVQKDQQKQYATLQKMAVSSNPQEIRNYFISQNKREVFDPSKLVQAQINRHIKVLSHKNKTVLKELLRQTPEAGKKPQEMKVFNEQRTLWSMCDEDQEIHQYLIFEEEIDFELLAKER